MATTPTGSGPAEPVGPRLRLGPDEQRLLAALEDRDRKFGCRLGPMLLGALYAMTDTENPYRFAAAAQGLRELLEKLPLHYEGAPVRSPTSQPREHLEKVGQALDRVKRESTMFGETGRWDGDADDQVRGFLTLVDGVVEAHRSTIKKPERNRQFIKKHDPLGGLPSDKIDELLQEWRRYDDYFQPIAHYGRIPDPSEFEGTVVSCVRFVVARIQPETAATFSLLDQIISEGQP